jgi:hypothetical protein
MGTDYYEDIEKITLVMVTGDRLSAQNAMAITLILVILSGESTV